MRESMMPQAALAQRAAAHASSGAGGSAYWPVTGRMRTGGAINVSGKPARLDAQGIRQA